MKQFKKLLTFSVLVFALATCAAQTDNKDVTITASGSGPTLDAARQSALRSAIEQAYGAFISSKTEMLNDQVVADEMASVSAGNIKSYEILNEAQRPDGRWGVTLKAIVSVDKLTSFVEAKGISIEVKGGMFALNIKQQLLNEQGEISAIADMIGLIHEPMQTAFDYTLKSSEPKSVDAESKNWEIPLEVTATCNKNIDFCANYIIKTLRSISLTNSEVETYKSLNKEVFPVGVYYSGKTEVFYLRKLFSVNSIGAFAENWNFYVKLFVVQSNGTESSFNGKEKTINFAGTTISNSYIPRFVNYSLYLQDFHPLATIKFPSSGDIAGTFSWSDKKTLSQIEQMTGFSVNPKGVVSKFLFGGYIVRGPSDGAYKIGIGINKENVVDNLKRKYPCENSGIRRGDRIISINGNNYIDMNQINEAIKSGDKITIELSRESKVLKFKITPLYVPPQKGLVMSLSDLDALKYGSYDSYSERGLNWYIAKNICDELVLNGYSDWRLPTLDELEFLYEDVFKAGIGDFGLHGEFERREESGYYWSCTDGYAEEVYIFKVDDSNWSGTRSQEIDKKRPYPSRVRAVREF